MIPATYFEEKKWTPYRTWRLLLSSLPGQISVAFRSWWDFTFMLLEYTWRCTADSNQGQPQAPLPGRAACLHFPPRTTRQRTKRQRGTNRSHPTAWTQPLAEGMIESSTYLLLIRNLKSNHLLLWLQMHFFCLNAKNGLDNLFRFRYLEVMIKHLNLNWSVELWVKIYRIKDWMKTNKKRSIRNH